MKVAVLYLSLPWVREASREAKQLALQIQMIPLLSVKHEDKGGPVNPTVNNYHAQLTNDMKSFMADIDKDQSY